MSHSDGNLRAFPEQIGRVLQPTSWEFLHRVPNLCKVAKPDKKSTPSNESQQFSSMRLVIYYRYLN